VFTEILKIKPQLDNADLNKMERTLGQRFQKIAKKFGGGIMSVLKAGGGIGIVLGLIDKLLNPLQAVQETIEKVLSTSDDIATNAQQFDTSIANLSKLVFIAKGSGLAEGDLYTIMQKFQTALATASKDKTSGDFMALKNYVGEKDIAKAFFQFIQELKKMDKNSQVLVQQQIFGEKQILKMSEFLNKDFAQFLKQSGLGNVSTKRLGQAVTKSADLNDILQGVRAANEAKNIIAASSKITADTVKAITDKEYSDQQREIDRIDAFKNLASISNAVTDILRIVDEVMNQLGRLITLLRPAVDLYVSFIKKIMNSRFMKGILGKEDK
jgi:tetrahydromethanopterin S-methyltransferase subunit G